MYIQYCFKTNEIIILEGQPFPCSQGLHAQNSGTRTPLPPPCDQGSRAWLQGNAATFYSPDSPLNKSYISFWLGTVYIYIYIYIYTFTNIYIYVCRFPHHSLDGGFSFSLPVLPPSFLPSSLPPSAPLFLFLSLLCLPRCKRFLANIAIKLPIKGGRR